MKKFILKYGRPLIDGAIVFLLVFDLFLIFMSNQNLSSVFSGIFLFLLILLISLFLYLLEDIRDLLVKINERQSNTKPPQENESPPKEI